MGGENEVEEIVVVPSKGYAPSTHVGTSFLDKYKAWGYINLGNTLPKFLAVYESAPVQQIRYFGKIKEIHPAEDNPIKISQNNTGKHLIELEYVIELAHPIPFGNVKIRHFFYTTLKKFLTAQSTDDLRP